MRSILTFAWRGALFGLCFIAFDLVYNGLSRLVTLNSAESVGMSAGAKAELFEILQLQAGVSIPLTPLSYGVLGVLMWLLLRHWGNHDIPRFAKLFTALVVCCMPAAAILAMLWFSLPDVDAFTGFIYSPILSPGYYLLAGWLLIVTSRRKDQNVKYGGTTLLDDQIAPVKSFGNLALYLVRGLVIGLAMVGAGLVVFVAPLALSVLLISNPELNTFDNLVVTISYGVFALMITTPWAHMGQGALLWLLQQVWARAKPTRALRIVSFTVVACIPLVIAIVITGLEFRDSVGLYPPMTVLGSLVGGLVLLEYSASRDRLKLTEAAL